MGKMIMLLLSLLLGGGIWYLALGPGSGDGDMAQSNLKTMVDKAHIAGDKLEGREAEFDRQLEDGQ